MTEMGCGYSKPKTVHVPEKIGHNKSDDNKSRIKPKEPNEYQKIDQHAKKAPNSLKNSAEELVRYLSLVSTDPRMLARGFFVWISENIRYDVDGFFGKTKMAPTDAESVMKNGSSVCEGYASVFELLCRKAGIPVKKISGFAKGYGYSPTQACTLNTETDHAWNAVQLQEKWYLLDCTWGAGHLDSKTNEYRKAFDDFYFLTEPKHFLTAHFPYMDGNLQESKKWQLLANPLSLDEFNKGINYHPQAFKLGVKAVSHTKPYFEMKNEVQMTFKSVGKDEIELTATLMFEEGNYLKEQQNATFCYQENDIHKILIHPQKTGMYELDIFGKLTSDETYVSSYVMEYKFKCSGVTDKYHEYPVKYQTKERCVLHEPLRGNLPAKTNIKFCIWAPDLQHVMVGKTYLTKEGTIFMGQLTTPEKDHQVTMYGTKGNKYTKMDGLYGFHTV